VPLFSGGLVADIEGKRIPAGGKFEVVLADDNAVLQNVD
jgi:hypothetical protein